MCYNKLKEGEVDFRFGYDVLMFNELIRNRWTWTYPVYSPQIMCASASSSSRICNSSMLYTSVTFGLILFLDSEPKPPTAPYAYTSSRQKRQNTIRGRLMPSEACLDSYIASPSYTQTNSPCLKELQAFSSRLRTCSRDPFPSLQSFAFYQSETQMVLPCVLEESLNKEQSIS